MRRSTPQAAGRPTSRRSIPIPRGRRSPTCAAVWRSKAISIAAPPKDWRRWRWDANLTAAVKRFQARMGLRQTGIVAGATLKALNVPASVRAEELAASARRLADLTFPFGDRYVVVNLPATAVEAVENGTVVHRYAAIVGDPIILRRRSPRMSPRSTSIQPGPCRSRSSRKRSSRACSAIPAISRAKRSASSTATGAEVDPKRIDWSTERAANYTLRQDSGAGNSLGSIRIDMPNKEAVYMHDTPSKRLFGADYRFLSHGCVRVQGVYDFAAWLLEGTSGGAGRRLGQGCAARRDQERRARGHQVDALDAGDLGLSDRLGERRRRRQFPQRRLWSRRRGRRVGERCAGFAVRPSVALAPPAATPQ